MLRAPTMRASGGGLLLLLSLLICGANAAEMPPRIKSAWRTRADGVRASLPQLLVLRGGTPPPAPVVEKPTPPLTNTSANMTQPSGQSRGGPTKQVPRTTFGVQDAVTAALGLSAAAALQWWCNKNYMAAMMALVPSTCVWKGATIYVRKPLWCLLSGTLAAVIFLTVRITNPSRAIVINKVVSKLVLNREVQSTLPTLAVTFLLGIVAAIQALPAFDLKLLWAMFSSLALIVGAAALKFGGRRPNLVELLDWAWDSLSSSVASSAPSSSVRR